MPQVCPIVDLPLHACMRGWLVALPQIRYSSNKLFVTAHVVRLSTFVHLVLELPKPVALLISPKPGLPELLGPTPLSSSSSNRLCVVPLCVEGPAVFLLASEEARYPAATPPARPPRNPGPVVVGAAVAPG
jgi:hypothetical protein